ncbi:MAG TPA: DUF2071 domain-containing protein [Candidatus Acidoferrales bacterium]|nr:DUF2071 domain-containing protein [Candidatus Acidoferrales bacterium]
MEGAVKTAAGALGGCAARVSPPASQVSHRPWPLPETRWLLYMRWHEVLFLHWPIRPERVRPLIPPPLELDTFDGWCWIGVVPFRMSGVRPRCVPFSFGFPELNVRTYVKTAGRSGVWFFSLDAASRIAVRGARWLGLPYYDARMSVQSRGETVVYESARVHGGAAPAEFAASYGPAGARYLAAPGTFDHWLAERYCLYAALRPEKVVYGEIHHAPWPLQPAETELRVNTMAQPIGIALADARPVAHFARYQEVVAWPVVPLEKAAPRARSEARP